MEGGAFQVDGQPGWRNPDGILEMMSDLDVWNMGLEKGRTRKCMLKAGFGTYS